MTPRSLLDRLRRVLPLLGIGGDATADVLPFVGHELADDFVDLTIERLTAYVPKRLWDEAMRSAGSC
jgi:phospholipase/carboxylesterase